MSTRKTLMVVTGLWLLSLLIVNGQGQQVSAGDCSIEQEN